MGHGILFLELAHHSLDRTKWVLPTNKFSTSRCLLQFADDNSWQHRIFWVMPRIEPRADGQKARMLSTVLCSTPKEVLYSEVNAKQGIKVFQV